MKIQLIYKKGTVLATQKTGADVEVVECSRFTKAEGRLSFWKLPKEQVHEEPYPFRSVALDQLADYSILEEDTDGQA